MSEHGARWAEPLYGLGSRVFHRAHDRGWLPSRALPVPVVSVGNLMVGGTGKTPAVLELARAALRIGRHPAILTRGYGGRRSRGVLRNGCWEDGTTARVRDTGDEALMLSRRLSTAPVVIGRNRAREGARLLATGTPVDLFLLDDGFQHRALRRDRDLVLLDARSPFGNQRLLPAGPLREPPGALCRAHHLLLTVEDAGAPVAADIAALLRERAPQAPWSRAWTEVHGLSALGGGEEAPKPLETRGLRVLPVAGIARPRRFAQTLEKTGMQIVDTGWFRDHHRFTGDEVRALEETARSLSATLVTTTKDAVRLEGLTGSAPWWVMETTLEVEGGWDPFLKTQLTLS